MPEITCDLSESQYAQVRDAAERAGMSIEEYAQKATAVAIAARYRPHEITGNVVSLEALKSRLRGPPGMP